MHKTFYAETYAEHSSRILDLTFQAEGLLLRPYSLGQTPDVAGKSTGKTCARPACLTPCLAHLILPSLLLREVTFGKKDTHAGANISMLAVIDVICP